MSAIGDYLRETRTELHHVAWPTRLQTVVYTVLVIAISIGVAVYLGVFDYIFTGALTRVIGITPAQGTSNSGIEVTQTPATSTQTASFNLGTSTKQ